MIGTRIVAAWACLIAAIVFGSPVRAELADVEPEAAVPDLPNPPEIRSRNGVLDAVFVAEPGKVTVATDRITSNVYNDLYIPPTLRVRRGDTMLLRLVNKIGPADVEIDEKQPTNIHFHGMDVSPQRPGDNVFVNISPGKSFQYRVDIPKDHPAGPALVPFASARVRRSADPVRPVRHAHRRRRHREPLSRVCRPAAAGDGAQGHQPAGRYRTDADGQRPVQPADPQPARRAADLGDRQSWCRRLFRPAARGASLLGARAGRQLPAQAGPAGYAVPAAGARTLVVVEAGAPGRYYFQTKDVDTGPTGLPSPRARLGTFVVEGPPVLGDQLADRLERSAANIKSIGLTGEELRTMPIAKRRTFTFSDAPDFSKFFINGKTYDRNRIDTKVDLGHVEEWTIRNVAGELHVFHLHQTSFLVKEVNGVQQDYPGLRDVINVPWKVGDTPGEVKLIIPFLNPADGRQVRLPLPHRRARGRRHDAEHRGRAATLQGGRAVGHGS